VGPTKVKKSENRAYETQNAWNGALIFFCTENIKKCLGPTRPLRL